MNSLANVDKQEYFIGIEVARFVSRVVVLDTDFKIVNYAESPMAGSVSFNHFSDLAPALKSLWSELNLHDAKGPVAVSVGSPHSGVGSGPAIKGWITSLESQIGRQIAQVGEPNRGVSYIPLKHVYDLVNAFKVVNVVPDILELAPISLARVFSPKSTFSFTVDSSIGWRSRLHSGHVLEALAYPEGIDTSTIEITPPSGKPQKIKELHNVVLSDDILAKSVELDALAIATGAAVGFAERKLFSNFIDALHLRKNSPPSLVVESETISGDAVVRTTQKLKAVRIPDSRKKVYKPTHASSRISSLEKVPATPGASAKERKSWPSFSEITGKNDVVQLDEKKSVPPKKKIAKRPAIESPDYQQGNPTDRLQRKKEKILPKEGRSERSTDIFRWYILFLVVLAASLFFVWQVGI